MRFVLWVWAMIAVVYGFGYFAGLHAHRWYDGMWFFLTSLVASIAWYYGKQWLTRRKINWEQGGDAAKWSPD